MQRSIIIALLALAVAVAAVKPRFNSRFSGKFQRLEAEPQQVPHDIYGPPPQNPPEVYGPPTTTEVQDNSTTTELPTTTEVQSENITTKGKLTQSKEQGVYYIYHPSGQLQKVLYSSKKDSGKAFSAQLKYENVDPITAPIFTYDPNTLQLVRLQV